MEQNNKLRSRLAFLESQLDQVLAERSHLERLLLRCGFPEGIRTLISTVEEVLNSGEIDDYGKGGFIASSDI